MQTSVRVTDQQQAYHPGSLIKGFVVIETTSQHSIDYIELELHPPFGEKTAQKISAQISKTVRVNGTKEFPFALTIPQNASDPTGVWKINAKVSDDEKVHVRTLEIRVAETVGTKISNVFWGLLISCGFLCVGTLGMAFGIGGHPDKIIPEGVLWFAFFMGLGAVLIARAIMGREDRGAPVPFMSIPVTVLMFGLGAIFLYMGLIDTEFTPLRWLWDFKKMHVVTQAQFGSVFNEIFCARTIMSVLAANSLWISIGGLHSRNKVSLGDLIMVAVISTSVLVLPFVVFNYVSKIDVGSISAIVALMGLVSLWWVIRNPIFTKLPTVMLTSALVPIAVGLVAIQDSQFVIPSAIVIGWGVVLAFLGGRNLISSAIAGVHISAMPSRVQIGNTTSIHAVISPQKINNCWCYYCKSAMYTNNGTVCWN